MVGTLRSGTLAPDPVPTLSRPIPSGSIPTLSRLGPRQERLSGWRWRGLWARGRSDEKASFMMILKALFSLHSLPLLMLSAGLPLSPVSPRAYTDDC